MSASPSPPLPSAPLSVLSHSWTVLKPLNGCQASLYQSHNVLDLDGVGNPQSEGGCRRGTYAPLRVAIFAIANLFCL